MAPSVCPLLYLGRGPSASEPQPPDVEAEGRLRACVSLYTAAHCGEDMDAPSWSLLALA